MIRRPRLLAIVVTAFAVGEANPCGWLYWKAAAWYLPQLKEAARQERPSPFENLSHDRWIAESAHAFAIDDRNPRAPVHVGTRVASLTPGFASS